MNGNGSTGSTSNNSSTDSSYFARMATTNASALSAHRSSPVGGAGGAMSRNNRSPQPMLDVDAPFDDKAALAQILNGIADMQREVSIGNLV
jgi:hypothetical protein